MLLESLLFLVFNVLFMRAVSQAIWRVVYKRAKNSIDTSIVLKQSIVLFFSLSVALLEIYAFLAFQ
jgi:hypothetical protein